MKKNIGRYFTILYIVTFGWAALMNVLADDNKSKSKSTAKKIEAVEIPVKINADADKGTKPEIKAGKKGKKRPLKTSTVMKSVIRPHCGALRKVLKGNLKTEEEWAEVISQAEILSEASFILMSDGRCPDEVWSGAATQTLRYCAQVIISAAEEKNQVVARTAFGKLTQSCSTCHDAHREKSPLMDLVE
ncbi:MAG: hypothetical protein QM496_08690 [Verrucomicrobiota bacterium]